MLKLKAPTWLYCRPRLFMHLHAMGLFHAHTQTNKAELARLARYAQGKACALEIGTHMGVSATVIAGALNINGYLYCVDPWIPIAGKENPCLTVCRRELARQGVATRVIFLRGLSQDIESEMPAEFDFIFVDGDHSYKGIQTDWNIVLRRLAIGGIVCLHDTSVPAEEPYRRPASVTYFDEVISNCKEFKLLETCHSLNILRRLQ